MTKNLERAEPKALDLAKMTLPLDESSAVTPAEAVVAEQWDLVIRPKDRWLDLHLDDLWRYRDLLWMFVRRDFVAVYKQTNLGPIWFFVQPLLTTLVFTIVFSGMAQLSTDGLPPMLFY